MHEILVNCLVKLASEKSVVRCTDHPDMTIAVDWDVNNQIKPKVFQMCYWLDYNPKKVFNSRNELQGVDGEMDIGKEGR